MVVASDRTLGQYRGNYVFYTTAFGLLNVSTVSMPISAPHPIMGSMLARPQITARCQCTEFGLTDTSVALEVCMGTPINGTAAASQQHDAGYAQAGF
mgnify:CR=1 FL=1